MLNIITRPFNGINGPNKVVQNLIKGLKKLNYPFIINGHIDACIRTYIPNQVNALRLLAGSKSNSIIGPNLFVLPNDIPSKYDFSRCLYVLPCEFNLLLWKQCNYTLSPLRQWATGIDTDEFKPSQSHNLKNKIVIYHKQRDPKELLFIEAVLKKKNIEYEVVYYGKYRQEEYLSLLKNALFIIWHGCHESQGIALQEALAIDIPILVCDVKYLSDQYQEGFKYVWDTRCATLNVTAAPYFDERCGLKIQELSQLDYGIEYMIGNKNRFSPREFVLQNLSLEGQARKLIDLYEYWGLSYADGLLEKVLLNKKYYDSILSQIKSIIKNILK